MNKIDIEKRWESYRLANSSFPDARDNELKRVFTLLKPRIGEKIWEIGTGNGCLTFPLGEAVGESGLIMTTDVFKKNIMSVKNINRSKKLSIKTKLLTPDSSLLNDKFKKRFDAVVSIATFHHFDNRNKGSKETGRLKFLKQIYTDLNEGGRLVLADPIHGTNTQKYFDSIDDPQYCYPDGHPHDFFTERRLSELLRKVGFKDIRIKVEYVPWKFNSKEQCKEFVHKIHNAKCDSEKSFEKAKKKLGFKKVGSHYELGWELFFLTAKK